MHNQHVGYHGGPKVLMHGPTMLFALAVLVCDAWHEACLLLLGTVCTLLSRSMSTNQQEFMDELCGHCHHPMKHHAGLMLFNYGT